MKITIEDRCVWDTMVSNDFTRKNLMKIGRTNKLYKCLECPGLGNRCDDYIQVNISEDNNESYSPRKL